MIWVRWGYPKTHGKPQISVTRGPFPENPGNFSGPKSLLKSKSQEKKAGILAYRPNNGTLRALLKSLLAHYNKEKVIVTKANKRTNGHAMN